MGMVPLTVRQLSVVCAGLRVAHTAARAQPLAAAAAVQHRCDCVGGCRVPVMQFSVPTELESACADALAGALSAMDAALHRALGAQPAAGGAFSQLAWTESAAVLPYVAL